MPEAEPPRHVGGPDEVELQKLVHGIHRFPFRGCRPRGGELRLERIAGDRGSLEHEAAALGQQAELFAQRGGDRGRDADRRRDTS